MLSCDMDRAWAQQNQQDMRNMQHYELTLMALVMLE